MAGARPRGPARLRFVSDRVNVAVCRIGARWLGRIGPSECARTSAPRLDGVLISRMRKRKGRCPGMAKRRVGTDPPLKRGTFSRSRISGPSASSRRSRPKVGKFRRNPFPWATDSPRFAIASRIASMVEPMIGLLDSAPIQWAKPHAFSRRLSRAIPPRPSSYCRSSMPSCASWPPFGLAREKPGQTLQATALVHEAFLRLVDGNRFNSGAVAGISLPLLPSR